MPFPGPSPVFMSFHQWQFQEPKLEVPTIYKAYVSGLCKGISPQNMAKHMVQYLHFRILEISHWFHVLQLLSHILTVLQNHPIQLGIRLGPRQPIRFPHCEAPLRPKPKDGWGRSDPKTYYPLVMTNIAIEMAIEIVDLPIKNCDFP